MKYGIFSFLVDVTDDSMSPKLDKGDFVEVRSGFEVEDDQIIAALVSDNENETTKLYIRKAFIGQNKITLRAVNPRVPDMVFEGSRTENVRVLGVVIRSHRYFGWENSRSILTGKIAKNNRTSLENHTGNITCESVEEER